MNFITTKVHGILDYLSGIFYIISPWLLGFANGGAAQWIPVVIGLMIISMAVFTGYEMGVIRIIPMRTHLTIDVFSGAFLAISPWLFGFANEIYWPHLILGLFEAGAGLFTRSTPTVTNPVR